MYILLFLAAKAAQEVGESVRPYPTFGNDAQVKNTCFKNASLILQEGCTGGSGML